MSSHFYEVCLFTHPPQCDHINYRERKQVALFGEFFSRDLKAILNRITLHSESSSPMHSREIVFEPIDAQHQRDSGGDPVILRAKKELTERDSGWSVFRVASVDLADVTRQGTLLVFEARISTGSSGGHRSTMGDVPSHWRRTEFRLRSGICVSWPDVHQWNDDLLASLRRRSQIYKRGYLFRRGSLVIQMFQQEQVKKDAVSSRYIFNVFTPRLIPRRNSLSLRTQTRYGRLR